MTQTDDHCIFTQAARVHCKPYSLWCDSQLLTIPIEPETNQQLHQGNTLRCQSLSHGAHRAQASVIETMADLPGRPDGDDLNLLSALQKSLEGCQEEIKDNNDATGPVINCSPNKDDNVKQTSRNHTDQDINHSPVEAIQAHSVENLGPASPGDDSTQAEGEETRMCGACCRGFGAHDLIQCPCGDEYCEGCLKYMFDMALDEEDEFPSQCCGIPIPANREWEFVNNDMLHRLDLKTEELSTPNRLYCARSDCGYWIRPEFILPNGLGICNNPRFWDVENQCYKDCLEWTCGLCKNLRHGGSDCPQEEEELNELADREGWQRCHLCQRLVELSYGCNHISRSSVSGYKTSTSRPGRNFQENHTMLTTILLL